MRTQVAIIGAGPAGTLLSLLLRQRGSSPSSLNARPRTTYWAGSGAGVLEWTSVEILRAAGLGQRLDADGHRHDSIKISWRAEELLSIDFERLAGKPMMAYGQTKDSGNLYAAAEAQDQNIIFGASDVEIHEPKSDAPWVTSPPTASRSGWTVTSWPVVMGPTE